MNGDRLNIIYSSIVTGYGLLYYQMIYQFLLFPRILRVNYNNFFIGLVSVATNEIKLLITIQNFEYLISLCLLFIICQAMMFYYVNIFIL